MLVTYRPEDTTAGDHGLRVVIGDTASASGTRRIDLPPLTPSAVADLVAEHARRPGTGGPPTPGSCTASPAATPFRHRGALGAGVDSSEVPATVRDAVLARTSRLAEPGRRVLEVVALAGSRTELDLLEAVLGDEAAAV